MGYAVCHCAKLKSENIRESYNHNYRISEAPNADESKSELNRVLVDKLNGQTYEEATAEMVRELRSEGLMDRKPRSDAVLGIEVMLTFSAEDAKNINLDDWTRACTEWLNEQFNSKDGYRTDNVRSAILHLDESTPHIHAYIVPIDEKGHLNAKVYLDGRATMREMQTSFAEKMKEFNLERGRERSVASHENIKDYYAHIQDSVSAELPEVRDNESAEEYRERANDCYKTERCTHNNEIRELEQELNQGKGKERELENAFGEELTPERIKKAGETLRKIENGEIEIVQKSPEQEQEWQEPTFDDEERKLL